jgi:hypothetical protein
MSEGCAKLNTNVFSTVLRAMRTSSFVNGSVTERFTSSRSRPSAVIVDSLLVSEYAMKMPGRT